VTATAAGNTRDLFAVPQYCKSERALDKDMLQLQDATLTLRGLAGAPKVVKLLGDGLPVEHGYRDGVLTVHLPLARRTTLPHVVAVTLAAS
jgi:alpha-L-fucosidase